jgi:soluble lytic murein transglycosylase-like protein
MGLYLPSRAAWVAAALLLSGALGVAPRLSHAFCFEEAAARYGVPEVLLRTIAELESGLDPEAAGWNADGSVDVGLMQINSWWESRLGPERWIRVCTDPCYNVLVGAWVLRDCLARYGYTVDGIGCYNARSPEKRERYTRKILRSLVDQVSRGSAAE